MLTELASKGHKLEPTGRRWELGRADIKSFDFRGMFGWGKLLDLLGFTTKVYNEKLHAEWQRLHRRSGATDSDEWDPEWTDDDSEHVTEGEAGREDDQTAGTPKHRRDDSDEEDRAVCKPTAFTDRF